MTNQRAAASAVRVMSPLFPLAPNQSGLRPDGLTYTSD